MPSSMYNSEKMIKVQGKYDVIYFIEIPAKLTMPYQQDRHS
jgi:hypothetical protein